MPIARAAISRAVIKNVIITAPLPTSQFVSAGGSIDAKTFSRFNDPERVIRRFRTRLTRSGSATVSGSGLGPYTFSGTADGDKGVLALEALDADRNVVAVALHVWGIGSAAGGDSIVTPPASTTNYVAADASLSGKTFSAFTDADGIIDNYNASIVSNLGNATESGTGLGPYTISGAVNGEFGVLKLDARDSSNNVVATAVHAWGIADGVATDGSQDFSAWKLLSTADITSTSDPNNLETSKGMVGNEIRFRGSRPGSGLDDPNDGCLYNFTIKDPADDSTVDPAAGEIIGIQFYFKFGTSVPQQTAAQFVCGVWNGTNGMFGGYKRDSATRLTAGIYTNTLVTSYTNSSGNAYLVDIGAADAAAGTGAIIGNCQTTVFDDSGSPARSGARVSGTSALSLSGTFTLALVFAGDVDVTVYYRLVKAPSDPF